MILKDKKIIWLRLLLFLKWSMCIWVGDIGNVGRIRERGNNRVLI